MTDLYTREWDDVGVCRNSNSRSSGCKGFLPRLIIVISCYVIVVSSYFYISLCHVCWICPSEPKLNWPGPTPDNGPGLALNCLILAQNLCR